MRSLTLALLLLAVPAAAVAEQPVAILDVTGLESTGDVAMDAAMTALEYGSMHARPDLLLQATASVIRVEVDHFAGGASVPMVADVGTQYDQTKATYLNATLSLVASFPGLAVQAICPEARCRLLAEAPATASAAYPGSEFSVQLHRPYQREAPRTSTAYAITTALNDTTGHLVGDLVLALWETDFAVTNESRHDIYQTGDLAGRGEPTGSDHVVDHGSAHADQAFVWLTNATLHVQAPGGEAVYVHGGMLSVDANGTMVASQAWGNLETQQGPQSVTGQDIQLEGQALIRVDRVGGSRLRSAVYTAEGLQVAGGPVLVVSSVGDAGVVPWPWLASGTVLVVGLSLAWRRRPRRRRRRGPRRVVALLDRGHYRIAAVAAAACMAMGSRDPMCLAVRAKAAWQQRRWKRAAQWAEAAYHQGSSIQLRADMALLAACAHARRNQHSSVGYWSRKALQLRPDYRELLLDDQRVVESLDRPESRRWLAFLVQGPGSIARP